MRTPQAQAMTQAAKQKRQRAFINRRRSKITFQEIQKVGAALFFFVCAAVGRLNKNNTSTPKGYAELWNVQFGEFSDLPQEHFPMLYFTNLKWMLIHHCATNHMEFKRTKTLQKIPKFFVLL